MRVPASNAGASLLREGIARMRMYVEEAEDGLASCYTQHLQTIDSLAK